MVTRIAQRELRNNNAEIVDRVEAGESFVVTRKGIPVADVTPYAEPGRPPRFPKTKDLVARRRVSEDLAPDAWLRDIREADSFLDDDPFARRA